MTSEKNNQHLLGLDLGGTNMLAGIVRGDGAIIARTHTETYAKEGYEGVLDRIVKTVQELVSQADMELIDLSGIGLAVAGALNVETGLVYRAENLDWDDVPLMTDLAQRLNRPVVIENDVNAAVWGEHLFGAGQERGDCFGVWVGTGIGGGLVLNGALYHGALFTAGEFGMLISTPDGEKGFRTVEDHASRTGMRRHFARLGNDHPDSLLHELSQGVPERVGTRELTQAYEKNDALACQIIEHGADRLGTAIANFVTMLSVDTVILGGGIVEALGDRYLQRVRTQFDRDVFPTHCRECKLIHTKLEGDAGILGAAMLAMPTTDQT
ncbi:MAG: ROK family protein [Planctomycetota bacterium]|nr:ROK family protein [Planctomycetota bacterium]